MIFLWVWDWCLYHVLCFPFFKRRWVSCVWNIFMDRLSKLDTNHQKMHWDVPKFYKTAETPFNVSWSQHFLQRQLFSDVVMQLHKNIISIFNVCLNFIPILTTDRSIINMKWKWKQLCILFMYHMQTRYSYFGHIVHHIFRPIYN